MTEQINLANVFLETASKQPEHPAIIGPLDETLTYSGLANRIETMALMLKAAGVKPGQSIGLHCASGPDYIVLTYGLWRCGACVVPIAVEMGTDEKVQICREICLDAVLSRPGLCEPLSPFCSADPIEVDHDLWFMPVDAHQPPPGFSAINAAFLRFTSGTTGISKGVILSHETIFERIQAANEALRLGRDDRVIWLLSMSYHFAVSIVAYLSFGATIVLPKTLFGPTILRAAGQFAGTVMYGPPLLYELMARDPSGIGLPSVRLAISTTTSLPRSTFESFQRRFGIGLSQAYGIIEIGLPCINVDRPLEKTGSVGRVLPAYEIRLEDSGLGDTLQAIKLRGKGMFDAYYSPWKPCREVMTDGWFATGDLGYVDPDGYLFIMGRSKEVINVAGMKFFPAETEAILNSHPAVVESCVFAHRHERLGETPHALVIPSPQSDPSSIEMELKDFCTRHLANYKVPERIHLVDKLIRTASGKLIRDETRLFQQGTAEYGLGKPDTTEL